MSEARELFRKNREGFVNEDEETDVLRKIRTDLTHSASECAREAKGPYRPEVCKALLAAEKLLDKARQLLFNVQK